MSKKKIIIIGGAAVAVIAIVVTLLLVFSKDASYRVIKVFDMEGVATVTREGVGDLEAYEGMTLESGDKLSVDANSSLVLLMDEDKYGYVEENSILVMIAEGDTRDSKTTIELERGAITCHVDGKLNSSSSYEVHTQNSVMAVRGTVFRVEFCGSEQLSGRDFSTGVPANIQNQYNSGKLSNGFTRTTVFEGTVSSTLINVDGTTGKTVILDEGQECWIGSNPSENFFLLEDTNIYSGSLPKIAVKALKTIAEEQGVVLSMNNTEINNLLNQIESQQTYEVYFYANGRLFGRQTVDAGSILKTPQLNPTEKGYWNIDLTKTINADTEVYWVAQ